jgi:hypothetical protein
VDAKIYCEQGGRIMLVTRTYDGLYSLLQQTNDKAYRNPDQWSNIEQPRIDHHTAQLGQFRAFSNRRERMLCRIYTYLRDGQVCSYQDPKLLSKLTCKLMAHIYQSEHGTKGDPKPATDAKKWGCTQSNGEFHDGGSAKCDLKEESNKVARLMAKKIDVRLAAGETNTAKVTKEVREAH